MTKLSFKWSIKAAENYNETIEYILEKFGEEVTLSFIQKVETIIELIRLNHNLFPKIENDIHRCVISSQSSITYKKEQNTIYIVSFYANRTNHNFYFEEG